MLRNTLRKNKGITLIALVVTIIVLLILAGISIAMLTGQNGILNRAAEAKEKTGTTQTEETVKLSVTDALTQGLGSLTDANLKTALNNNIGAGKYEISGDATSGWTVTVKGKEYKIDSTGKIDGTTTGGGETGTLPTGEGTTPYLPNGTFSKKEGDLATGLVIKDSNDNEYVWVEVPKTIYTDTKYNTTGTTIKENEWEKIRDCLKEYTKDYSSSSYKDTNTDGTTYSDDYKNMLKSVYTNGGFWIGRYEAGLEGDTPRTSYTEISESDKAVIKPNMYPYNYVTRDEAQTLAQKMNYGDCKGSLIFGIQWDLTLKYIEEKTVELAEEANKDAVRTDIKSKLTSDSTQIGNYNNNLWRITNTNAKYSNNDGSTYIVCPNPYTKTSSSSILLTTGADTSFSLMNIYDLAGNVWEWTLEFCTTSDPCVNRGASFDFDGSNSPAGVRDGDNTGGYSISFGFRVGLWK